MVYRTDTFGAIGALLSQFATPSPVNAGEQLLDLPLPGISSMKTPAHIRLHRRQNQHIDEPSKPDRHRRGQLQVSARKIVCRKLRVMERRSGRR
jgi:hypothetical protein